MGYHNIEKRALRYFLARVEKYHIEHILSHNETNKNYFDSEEEFETSRNQLGGLLLLKDIDNISSGNEEYVDKLKTYSAGLVWGHTLVDAFHHVNKELEAFNEKLNSKCGIQICPIAVFDKGALEQRNKLLYEIVKIIWEIDN